MRRAERDRGREVIDGLRGDARPVDGLDPRQPQLVAEAGVLDSLELFEVNPFRDHENTTAGLAVELAASALGVRIL